jgi:DNA polymerase III subunit gamma/tau
MSYLVLARRWRPKRFSDLVGQDVVVRTLKNALSGGNLAHAYLLTGIRGVGKTTIARLMAMAVNCAHPSDGEPCGECEACTAILRGSNLDVQEMDAASHTGVDDVREILDGVRYPPTSLKYKVYIIDEAHMLSKSAFNALLKTLEEPPARVLFILATTEIEKLPVTVRSRCQRFDLRRLGTSEIADYLNHVLAEEGIACEGEAAVEIARAADGSVRDALSLTERVLAYAPSGIAVADVRQALALVGPEPVRRLTEATFEADAGQALTVLREALAHGNAPRALAVALGELLHELSLVKVDAGLLEYEPGEEHRDWLQRWAMARDALDLDLRYQVVVHALRDLGWVDDRRGVEMLLLRLCGLDRLSDVPITSAPERPAAKASRSPAPIPAAASPKSKPEAKAVTQPATQQDVPAEETDAEAPVKAVVDTAIDSEAVESDLPLVQQGSPGSKYAGWEEAVSAYAALKPGVAAMLDHVICAHFGDKIRLGLDAHQQLAISHADRMAFSEWIGREVFWESKDEHEGETLSEVRTHRAEAEEERLRHQAENDPHVQTLVRELDAQLLRVRPAGAQGEDSDAAEAEQG